MEISLLCTKGIVGIKKSPPTDVEDVEVVMVENFVEVETGCSMDNVSFGIDEIIASFDSFTEFEGISVVDDDEGKEEVRERRRRGDEVEDVFLSLLSSSWTVERLGITDDDDDIGEDKGLEFRAKAIDNSARKRLISTLFSAIMAVEFFSCSEKKTFCSFSNVT